MSLDLLERLQAANSDEERAWIVTELSLAALEPAAREAVWAAAIPHWFDADFLAALLARPLAEIGPIYEQLSGLSFIERFPERGHDVHERTRALLLNRLWRDDEARFRLYSQRAADYCVAQDQADTGWRIETIYHLLIADPVQGADELQNQGWIWHNPPHFAYDKIEALARAGREHADAGRLSSRGLGWTQFWEALLDYYYSRMPSARERFLQIQINPKYDPCLVADIAFRIGDISLHEADYPTARRAYEDARPIFATIGHRLGEANCVFRLGDISLQEKDYLAARAAYETARLIYSAIGARLGETNCIYRLGDISLQRADYPTARALYEIAHPICVAIGNRLGEANCIRRLGDVSLREADYLAARVAYETARPIYSAIGNRVGEANCIRALGDVNLHQADYGTARTAYETARSIYAALGNRLGEASCIQRLGDVASQLEDWSTARSTYWEAITLYHAIGDAWSEANALDSLAQSYTQEKSYEQAIETFGKAIQVYSGEPEWYENRAATYLQLRNFTAAAADLARATALQADHPYLALRRGDLAFKQGAYDAAAGHYRQFIAGLPKVNSGHFGLGLALICLGQAAEGLAEVRQALALTYAPREVKGFSEELAELIAAGPERAGLAEALALVQAWVAR
jgi:tetratricopeptide (TPR) repeat protein